MKIRSGFVSNSSSSSFLITNTSDVHKTIVDFIRENPQLLTEYLEEYTWQADNTERYNINNMMAAAGQYDYSFDPKQTVECAFGDEDGTVLGDVYDYILRDGGQSESFTWRYHESLR